MSDLISQFVAGSSIQIRTSATPPITIPLAQGGKESMVLSAIKGWLNPEIAVVNGDSDIYTFDLTGQPPSQNWPIYFGILCLAFFVLFALIFGA